jgi:hypothetical protein
MRVDRLTGICRLRAPMEVIVFWGKGNVLNERKIAFANFETFFEACFGFKLLLYK